MTTSTADHAEAERLRRQGASVADLARWGLPITGGDVEDAITRHVDEALDEAGEKLDAVVELAKTDERHDTRVDLLADVRDVIERARREDAESTSPAVARILDRVLRDLNDL